MTRRIEAASTNSPIATPQGESAYEFTQVVHQTPTSNFSSERPTASRNDGVPQPGSIFRLGAHQTQTSQQELASSQPKTPLPLQPFQARLTHRRQAYVPTQSRTPWQSLNSLFSSGQLQCIALFESQLESQFADQNTHPPIQAAAHPMSHWAMARIPGLTTHLQSSGDRIQAYLRIDIAHNGDLLLELVPALEPQQLLAASPFLTQSRGITPFRLLTADNFITRLEQLRKLPTQIQLQFETCIDLYQQLEQQALHANQARQFFDRLLDRSPLPQSQTPASERLLQRRQLLQAFTQRSTHSSPSAQTRVSGLSMWDAYAAVAHWTSLSCADSDSERMASSSTTGWLSCSQGHKAELLNLAQELALSWRPAAVPPPSALAKPRRSGAQRSLEASGALQMRIQQRSKHQTAQLAEALASG